MPLVHAVAATLDFRYCNLETFDDIKANRLRYCVFLCTLYAILSAPSDFSIVEI